ncbi:MAG: CHASE domain-containing protein, partial [Spongiibacter sp.]
MQYSDYFTGRNWTTMPVDDNNNADPDLLAEEKALERAGRLHWFHWLVLAFSLVLTLSVWQYSSRQLQEKMDNRFTQQGEQIAALVKERLQKYEDALWSGVAAIHSHGGDISFADWQTFAEALHIGEKYPGINGIGVIHQVAPQQRQQYLALQRTERPDFQIHPSHDQNV